MKKTRANGGGGANELNMERDFIFCSLITHKYSYSMVVVASVSPLKQRERRLE